MIRKFKNRNELISYIILSVLSLLTIGYSIYLYIIGGLWFFFVPMILLFIIFIVFRRYLFLVLLELANAIILFAVFLSVAISFGNDNPFTIFVSYWQDTTIIISSLVLMVAILIIWMKERKNNKEIISALLDRHYLGQVYSLRNLYFSCIEKIKSSINRNLADTIVKNYLGIVQK